PQRPAGAADARGGRLRLGHPKATRSRPPPCPGAARLDTRTRLRPDRAGGKCGSASARPYGGVTRGGPITALLRFYHYDTVLHSRVPLGRPINLALFARRVCMAETNLSADIAVMSFEDA